MRKNIISLFVIGAMLLSMSWVRAEESSPAAFPEIRGGTAAKLDNLSLDGDVIGASYAGSSARFDNVDFGTEGIGGISLLIGVPGEHAGKRIEFYIDSLDGEPFAYIEPADTGGFGTRQWQEGVLLDGEITGIHSVYFLYTAPGCGDVEAFRLMPVKEGAAVNVPPDLIGSGAEKAFAELWALDILEWDGESNFGAADILTAGAFARMAAMLKGTRETGELLAACGLAESAPITAQKACELLVRLLGREKLTLDTEIDFVAEASKAGIQISGDREAALDGLAAIQLLYAASAAEPVTVKKNQDGGKENTMTFEILQDNTLLIAYRKIHKLDGVLTMDSVTGLDETSDLSQNEVLIDGYIYEIGQCDVSGLLGHGVDFYYEEGPDVNTLLYIAKAQKDQSITVEANNIDSYANRTLKYFDENDRLKSRKIPDDAKIIYNGLAISRYSESIFNIGSGTVELIDNDGRDDIEVVTIWDSIDYLAAGVVDGVLYLEDADQFPDGIDLLSGEHEIVLIDNKGAPTDYDRIAENNVCSISKAEAMDGSAVRYTIAVSKKTASGIVGAVNQNEHTITIGGQEYPIAKAFDPSVLAGISSGNELRAYLNRYGEMAFIQRESAVRKLAYLVKSYADENEDVFIRLFTEDGEMVTYRCDENIQINNIKPENVMDHLMVDGATRNEVLLYTLNGQGNVRKITFPESEDAGAADTGLYHYFDVSGVKFKYNTGSLGGKAVLANDFICFKIPEDPMDYEKYAVGGKDFSDDEPLVMKCYNRSQGQLDISVGVLSYDPDSPFITDGADIYYVLGVETGLNADDEVTVQLEYYNGGGKTIETAPVAEGGRETALALKRGDAIRFAKTKAGEIGAITKMFSVEDGEILNGSTGFNAHTQIVSGTVYKKQGSLIQLAENEEVFNCSGAAVYLYYGPDKPLEIGGLTDLIGRKNASRGTDIYLYARYSSVRSIVVDMRN